MVTFVMIFSETKAPIMFISTNVLLSQCPIQQSSENGSLQLTNLHDRGAVQRRPFHLGELLVVEPHGAPEGAREHIQVPADATSRIPKA